MDTNTDFDLPVLDADLNDEFCEPLVPFGDTIGEEFGAAPNKVSSVLKPAIVG